MQHYSKLVPNLDQRKQTICVKNTIRDSFNLGKPII